MAEEPEHRIPRLQTLLETVRLLNSTLELKELTGIILDVVRAEIAVQRVSVFIVERDRKMLRPLVTQEADGGEIAFPIGVGIAGVVAATGEVLDIPDAYADRRFNSEFDRQSGFYTNDLFALPVFNRTGEIVGVMELLNRLRPITAADREFLLGMSVYIGLALENAYLHFQFTRSREVAEVPARTVTSEDALTFALGILELIPDQGQLPSSVWNHVEAMRRDIAETAAGALKVREFLDLQRDQLSWIDLASELRSLSEMQTDEWRRRNIQVALIAEKAPPVYTCVPDLRLVLAFLIRRAEAAVLERESNRDLRIHLCSAGRNVCIGIQYDTVADELGASPGFAVASRILQQCGGQARFESVDGKTTISVELPVAPRSIAGGTIPAE